MTKRCKFCGVKMNDAEINGKAVWQCPACGYVTEKEEPPSSREAEAGPLREELRDMISEVDNDS